MKTYIVIHHSATPDGRLFRNFDAILKDHLARGWRDIGYHWVVEYANNELIAIPGRNENDVAAACPGRNVDGIHICCIGNFQEEVPTEEVYRFVAQLCRGIKCRHPILEIGGHRDYDASLCPGKNFDMEHLRQLVKGDDNLDTPVKVVVKGQEIEGKLIDGVTWVPLRQIVELMNEDVEWQGPDKPVIVE